MRNSLLTTLFFVCSSLSLFPLVSSSSSSLPTTADNKDLLLSPTKNINRYLAAGDFDSVNEILKGATIALPDVDIVERYLIEELVLNLTNILCNDLYISDIDLRVLQSEPRNKTFLLEAIKIDTVCLVDYQYGYGIFSGAGVVQAFTEDNNLSVELGIGFSDQQAQEVPNVVTASNCTSLVEITNLVFDGGLIASLLNFVDGLIRGVIEKEINDFLCQELLKLNTAGTSFLQNVSDFLDPYLVDEDDGATLDVLVVDAPGYGSENNNVTLIDFENPSPGMARTVDSLLEYAFEVLAANSTGADGKPTLGINDVIESFLLEPDGSFSLDGTNVFNDGLLFNTSITESSFLYIEVSLKNVQLVGLNTFTRVDPLITSGPYTLESGFALDRLETVVDIEIYVQSVSDQLEEEELAEITETATMGIALTGIDLSNTSLLVALEEEKLAVLPFGSFLDTSRILSCVASTLYDFDVALLEFQTTSLSQPTVGGLQSPGIERLVVTGVEELYPLYQDAILKALPNFIETTGKDLLVDAVQDLMNDPTACDPSEWTVDASGTNGDEFVDFRYFFLSDEDAAALGAASASKDDSEEGGGGGGSRRDAPDYGNIGQEVRELMDTELLALDPTTGLPKINTGLIDPLTVAQSNVSGTWMLGEDLLSLKADFELDEALAGQARLEVLSAQLENLDTIAAKPLQLLEPTRHANILANEFQMGFPDRPLTLSTRLLLDIKADVNGNSNQIDIYNVIDLELDLVETTVVLDILLSMLTQRVLEFPLRDVADLNCWLATIPPPAELDDRGVRPEGVDPTAAIADLKVLVNDLDLRLSCVNCSSPTLEDVTAALQDPSSRADAVKSANNLLDFATSILQGEFVQLQIDRLLNDAPTKCPHRPEYIADPAERPTYVPFELEEGDESSNDAVAFLLTLCITVVALVLVFFAIRTLVGMIVRRRHKKYLQSLPPQRIFAIYRQQLWMRKREERLTETTRSMLHSEGDIPKAVRYLIPVILLGNIAFFLSGHLNVGGSVIVIFTFAGQEITIPDFFTFSVAQSTLDLWEAGGESLAILILLFSGVWPYTKMVLTLYAWVRPPTKLSVTQRGRLILLLDELAKWSTIDIFVLVLSLIAFRVSITSPNLSFLPDGFYSVDLLVLPKWGLYANLIAQLLSQFTSHVIIHYHRKIVTNAMSLSSEKNKELSAGSDGSDDDDDEAEKESENDDEQEEASSSRVSAAWEDDDTDGGDQEEPTSRIAAASTGEDSFTNNEEESTETSSAKCLLKEHAFVRPHRGESGALVVKGWVHYLVYAVSILLLPLLVIVGCFLSSFSLEYLGLLGLGIEAGQEFEEAQYEYSVFDIAKALMDQASLLGQTKDYVGLGSIVFVFLLTVLVVPILQTIALLVHWIRPMTRPQRKRWIVMVEILQAWQYVEVFVIAVILSAWQFASVSEFFLNQYCEALDDILATLAFYGILKQDDAQCFQVIATIKTGTYLLIGAAFLLNLFNTFVMKAVLQREREADQLEQEQVMMEKLLGDEVDGLVSSTERLVQETTLEAAIAQIEPVPALFTDSFRWLLVTDWSQTAHQQKMVYADNSALPPLPPPVPMVIAGDDEVMSNEMMSVSVDVSTVSTPPPRPANMGIEVSRGVDNRDQLLDVEEPSGPLRPIAPPRRSNVSIATEHNNNDTDDDDDMSGMYTANTSGFEKVVFGS
uniref:Uncharacterized protein n=1 Tax=Grammatophora oceanica TaxID=210454 RepID=A0A7S1YM47_9STRA|mmetsp:Transcript_5657/g.7930  ORF Transcript_5657/g.7930 Transcript_5657/m.7930 type:complete len:1690 (+) Transcript_5657:125-5194(+)